MPMIFSLMRVGARSKHDQTVSTSYRRSRSASVDEYVILLLIADTFRRLLSTADAGSIELRTQS